MKLFQINKNIAIVCNWHNTRNGFKHTATLLYDGQERDEVKICYLNRTWERFEFESVLEKLVEETGSLTDKEKKLASKYIKNYGHEPDPTLKNVAMVASLGEIFGKTKEEKNDWKTRMLKAGLGNRGLIMPDDWDELSEDEKEKRLNGALEQLNK